MRKFSLIALSAAIACLVVWGADWPSQSGNPQRDGWAKAEKAFTKDNARNIELLYKVKADNQAMGLQALTSPLIDGILITYLGFKEMLVFGGSADNVYSVDADINRFIWKVHLDYKGEKPKASGTSLCPGGMTAALAMPGSSTAAGRGFGGAAGRGAAGRGAAGRGPDGRGVPAAPAPVPPGAGRGAPGLFATGFGRAGLFLAVSGDGSLHVLNTSTGADRIPPVKFLPPNSKASSLNIDNGVIYAATEDNCGGNANALYALDMNDSASDGAESGQPANKLASLPANGGAFTGVAATAIGNDGTVYAQVTSGQGDVAGQYNYTVLAMNKDLQVKDYFTPSGAAPAPRKDIPSPGATPVVFAWKGRDVIVAGGPDGRLYLLDSKSLGGADHHTPLCQSEPVASPDTNYAGNGFHGTFSSWEDADNNTRWVYASLWGPPDATAKFPAATGATANRAHGSIAAFKVEESNGQPILTPQWLSRDMLAPAPVATANGLVFALSTGESAREAKETGKPYSVSEREKMASRATLYVLDGETGGELYSSGNTASTFSHGSGLAVANRRIYFTTHDDTVYAFGFLAEQPQLTGK